jgi:hypothetical protein
MTQPGENKTVQARLDNCGIDQFDSAVDKVLAIGRRVSESSARTFGSAQGPPARYRRYSKAGRLF